MRAGQALVLTRLIEVMLVEALRSAPEELSRTGLLADFAIRNWRRRCVAFTWIPPSNGHLQLLRDRLACRDLLLQSALLE